MTQLILNFQNDSEATGGMMTSSSPVASLNHANPTQPQEKGKGRTILDIYGQKCLGQFEKLSHAGLWAKMFTALLIGQEGWCSTRCSLIWKMRGTKYNRIYFQLRVLTPLTNDIESSLLPTVYTTDWNTPLTEESKETFMNNRKEKNLKAQPSALNALRQKAYEGLLPTPRTVDVEGGLVKNVQTDGNGYYRENAKGVRWGVKLRDVVENGLLPTPMAQQRNTTVEQTIERQKQYGGKTRAMYLENYAVMGMLPTPMSRDFKAGSNNDRGRVTKDLNDLATWKLLPTPKVGGQEGYETRAKRQGHEKAMSHLEANVQYQTGTTSQQLNPQFVLEMMGFPIDWTELPFLSGETKQ